MKKSICICFAVFLMGFAGTLKSDEKILLETIGQLSAQNLYLTFTSIGATADAYGKGVYKKKQTKLILQSYLNMSILSKTQLLKLLKTKHVRGTDIKAVKQLITGNELLIAEGTAFKKYIDSGSRKDLADYEKNRKAAWKKIAAIMGIK